jgi:hypothetical protein
MPTLLEFQLQPKTDESFNITVFVRGQESPLAFSRLRQ